MLSNHCEWSSSSNRCLRKIISAASGAKKGPIFDRVAVWFIQQRRWRTKIKTIPQVIQWQLAFSQEGRLQAAPPHILPCSEPPPLLSLLSSCSCKRHKWICRLTFQGSEQQMISSSKAKDKDTEAPGFLLRKHREQTYKQRRGPQSKQHRAGSLLFRARPPQSERNRDETAQKLKMPPCQRRQRRPRSRCGSNLEDNGAANEIAGRGKKKKSLSIIARIVFGLIQFHFFFYQALSLGVLEI